MVQGFANGAAKAALIFGTERWALEFLPYGIRVTGAVMNAAS
jgi:NAD(P)-dependent dehydrogenase (short-subunit alcohol dehydrogenase family)